MGTERALWRGLGLIEDIKFMVAILNRREWLEKLRLSDDPDAQRFAAELLDDADTLDEAQDAAANVLGMPEEVLALDPAETIERLDARAQDHVALRRRLVQLGALGEDDHETDISDLVVMLLS